MDEEASLLVREKAPAPQTAVPSYRRWVAGGAVAGAALLGAGAYVSSRGKLCRTSFATSWLFHQWQRLFVQGLLGLNSTMLGHVVAAMLQKRHRDPMAILGGY